MQTSFGAVGPGAVGGLKSRWIGLSEGSCVHEGRQRSREELLESQRIPFSLIPSFLCWVGALGCLQLWLWSSCWKKMCTVGFLLKVMKGLMAFVPDSLWVNSSGWQLGVWQWWLLGPLSSISEGQRAWRCCCLCKPLFGWRGGWFWGWVFIFSSPYQPNVSLTGPCSVLLLGQPVPVGVPAGHCHLSTGPGEVELLGL